MWVNKFPTCSWLLDFLGLDWLRRSDLWQVDSLDLVLIDNLACNFFFLRLGMSAAIHVPVIALHVGWTDFALFFSHILVSDVWNPVSVLRDFL